MTSVVLVISSYSSWARFSPRAAISCGGVGSVCGVGYGSVMGQIQRVQTGEPDPATAKAEIGAVVKVALFALSVTALITTLRARPPTGMTEGDDQKV